MFRLLKLLLRANGFEIAFYSKPGRAFFRKMSWWFTAGLMCCEEAATLSESWGGGKWKETSLSEKWTVHCAVFLGWRRLLFRAKEKESWLSVSVVESAQFLHQTRRRCWFSMSHHHTQLWIWYAASCKVQARDWLSDWYYTKLNLTTLAQTTSSSLRTFSPVCPLFLRNTTLKCSNEAKRILAVESR